MTCPQHETLSAYIDDSLPAAERALLASHLSLCPICRHRTDELKALRQALRELPSPALGFDLAARLDGRLHAGMTRGRRARSFWSTWVSPAGLSVAALVSGVWLGGLLVGAGTTTGAAPASMARMLDPVPPGGLCAAAELCRLSKGMP